MLATPRTGDRRDDPDQIRLVLPIRDLAHRHIGHGAREEHYESVGAALLWTLGAGLGPAFTPEVRDAWAAASCRMLAATMTEAARDSGRMAA